jgi:nuclease S1
MRQHFRAWCLWFAIYLCIGRPAAAWGDEGHEIVGSIAEHYLTPAVRARVQALLATDDTGLCARDIAHESTWADKYRDSDRDGSKRRYYGTRNWHFVDLEIDGADLNRACHGRPPLPAGTPASMGPADDCIVDKIEEFRAELRSPRTDPRERLLALQFLLHFVGDLHQPLHAADDHDQGGNKKIASAPGIGTENLHHDWDIEFVARLGADERDSADRLIARITDAQRRQWSRGTPVDWALESFSVAKTHAYGLLPPPQEAHRYLLPESYVVDAVGITAEQLSKAGVRLAAVLNQALE